jgi:outer membrane biosynthesis protein TonB
MKPLSKQERDWFEAMRVGACQLTHVFRPDPFADDLPRTKRYRLRGWVSLAAATVLFFYSFSGAWANPGEELPPSDVLIPMDDLLKEQVNGHLKLPPETAAEQEQQTEQQQPQTKQQPAEEKASQQPPANQQQTKPQQQPSKQNEAQVEPQQQPVKPPAAQTAPKTPPVAEKQPPTTSPQVPAANMKQQEGTYQTENGGKLPATATPLLPLFFQGMALMLLGFGLSSFNNARNASVR